MQSYFSNGLYFVTAVSVTSWCLNDDALGSKCSEILGSRVIFCI